MRPDNFRSNTALVTYEGMNKEQYCNWWCERIKTQLERHI